MQSIQNPFEFKLVNKMTKKERVEAVAHVAFEEIQRNNGSIQFGFLFKFFPTWSANTIMAGEKLCDDYLKSLKKGEL